MKKEDFERLKAKLGDEFTAEHRVEKDVTIVLVSKKDIWDGVEFALIDGVPENIVYKNGKIVKISRCQEIPMLNPSWAKPSTEQAYIDQLKKEAHERFGEIQGGDRFDFTEVGFPSDKSRAVKIGYSNEKWEYDKELDRLYLHGFSIYQQGKWATRVKERVEVEMSECVANFGTYQPYTIEAKFTIKNVKDYDHANLPNFLRSQLEKYLNGEIE